MYKYIYSVKLAYVHAPLYATHYLLLSHVQFTSSMFTSYGQWYIADIPIFHIKQYTTYTWLWCSQMWSVHKSILSYYSLIYIIGLPLVFALLIHGFYILLFQGFHFNDLHYKKEEYSICNIVLLTSDILFCSFSWRILSWQKNTCFFLALSGYSRFEMSIVSSALFFVSIRTLLFKGGRKSLFK